MLSAGGGGSGGARRGMLSGKGDGDDKGRGRLRGQQVLGCVNNGNNR